MNANELLAYNQGYNAGLKAGIDLNTEPMLRQQQETIDYQNEEYLALARFQKSLHAEIEALKKVLQEVVRISDRNHDAWNKAKELLK